LSIPKMLIFLFLLLQLALFGCVETTYYTKADDEKPSIPPPAETRRPKEITPKQTAAAPLSEKKEPIDHILTTTAPHETGMLAVEPDAEANLPAATVESSVSALSDKQLQTLLDESLDYCQVSQEFWQKGELENALEALDQAYQLLLKVETDDNAGLMQQKEDLRFTISKRIMEIYASRNIVVNGNHNAIPMDLNRHVQAEINLFTTGREKNFFLNSYKRSGRYRAEIVKELKAAGLPEELSWLPLIESGFKTNALSPARALGLWQFIPSTGYKFGLKRNVHIDERLDPAKATKAAIAYLKELHSIFGDWATVLAAYNCGEGRVLRVIRDQNVNYLDNFWDLYERLPRETARYVPRFLASLHILKNLDKYGLAGVRLKQPHAYETVTISRQIALKDAARVLKTDLKTLKALNPELRRGLLPPENYSFSVPPGKSSLLLAKLDKIPISTPPRQTFVYHRIRKGESLSTIARRYRTSVRSIVRANNIRRNRIIAGKKLKIPRKGYTTKHIARTKKPTKAVSPKIITYKVKSGDSLWILARRYGTTTAAIQRKNRLKSTKLRIKQVLKIPSKSASSRRSTATLKTYRVSAGDSPYRISMRNNMTLERFLRINKLTPKSTIYPGQRVYIE